MRGRVNEHLHIEEELAQRLVQKDEAMNALEREIQELRERLNTARSVQASE